MARSRNIKPGFFQNDILAEKNCPLGRILFIGLWTIADYKGDLEWRPARLKAQLLPYDNCDIKKIAINLDKSGFIRFYSDGDVIYLNIVNFTKHQNPHKNERESGSDIPAYSEMMRQVIDLKDITINRDLSRLKPEQNETNPADSLNPITDSLNPITDYCKPEKQSQQADKSQQIFDYWCHVMGKTGNVKFTPERKRLIIARLKDGYTVEHIKQAIDGCSRSDYHMARDGKNKTIYDDLTLICRNGSNIEKFALNIGQGSSINGLVAGYEEFLNGN